MIKVHRMATAHCPGLEDSAGLSTQRRRRTANFRVGSGEYVVSLMGHLRIKSEFSLVEIGPITALTMTKGWDNHATFNKTNFFKQPNGLCGSLIHV